MSSTGKILTGLAIGIGAGVALGYFLNSEKGEEYISSAKDTAEHWKDKAGEYKDKVKNKAGEYTDMVKDKLNRKASEVEATS